MLRFLYWAVDKTTGENVNFIDENLYEVGDTVLYKGQEVVIVDMAVDNPISCDEIKMQMEDLMYV